MVAHKNPTSEVQDQAEPSRKQNAMRVAKFGLLAGAVAGFFGIGGGAGGLLGALQMGGMFALGSAVLGAVAGNKLNPLLDRVTSILPGQKGKAKAAPAQEQAVEVAAPSVAKGHGAAPSVGADELIAPPSYQPVSTLSPEALAGMRAESSASLTKAAEGMSPDAHAGLPDQWQSRDAAGKRVTHGGSAALQ